MWFFLACFSEEEENHNVFFRTLYSTEMHSIHHLPLGHLLTSTSKDRCVIRLSRHIYCLMKKYLGKGWKNSNVHKIEKKIYKSVK